MKTSDHLREMIEVISGELELRPLLTTIVQKACELLDADRGSIGLVDEERGLVKIEAAYRMPLEELGSISKKGEGLAGAVYAAAAPVILDRYGDVHASTLTGMDEDVVVGMPIKWRGRMLGTFGIGSDRSHRFTQDDLETLELFARHAAIAINNARSYEREKRRAVRLRAANIIGESALERDPLKIVAVAETALRTALDIKCKVLKKTDSAPEGSQIIPFQFDAVKYDRLAVLSPALTSSEDRQSLEALAAQIGLALERARLMKESRRQLEEIRLLYETSRRASTAMDLKSVVSAYLSYVAARDRFRCEIGLIDREEDGTESLTIIGRWTQTHGVAHLAVRYDAAALGVEKSLEPFELFLSPDVFEDPDASEALRAIMKRASGKALAAFPLIAQGERIGVIVLTSVGAHEWTEADIRPYQTTGALLASIIKNRLDHRRLLKNEQRLATLAERRRLARDLHDSVSQLIFSMSLMAQSVGEAFLQSAAEGQRRVDRLLEIAQLARAEMKALLVELKDPEGEESGSLAVLARRHGLESALERHRAIAAPADVDIALRLDGVEKLNAEQSEACLRVAQEAIANAVRHGEARHVAVLLVASDEGFVFSIDDDGTGFDNGGAGNGSSRIGLESMERRIALTGGALRVLSSGLGGARVEVRLPLQ